MKTYKEILYEKVGILHAVMDDTLEKQIIEATRTFVEQERQKYDKTLLKTHNKMIVDAVFHDLLEKLE